MFDKQFKLFNKRKRRYKIDDNVNVFQENLIGRVYTVLPSNTGCLYLRLLLHNIKGPTLNAGEGTLAENEHGEIFLSPGYCKTVYTLDNVIETIYPETNNISTKENTWFSERAILCLTNEIVKCIKSVINKNLNAVESIYT